MPAPIVEPVGPLAKDGKSVTMFVASMPVNWTTTGGAFSAANPAAGNNWTAPNVSGTYKVRATNPGDGTFTEVTVTVMAVMPPYWEFESPGVETKNVTVFVPQAGPTQSRSLSDWRNEWDVKADDSSKSEYDEMRAFIRAHFPGKVFAVDDPVVQERRFYKFIAPFNKSYHPGDGFAWNSRIREEWPYAVVDLSGLGGEGSGPGGMGEG